MITRYPLIYEFGNPDQTEFWPVWLVWPVPASGLACSGVPKVAYSNTFLLKVWSFYPGVEI